MNNMDKPEYDKVEKPALDQLQQYGWLYVHGSELTPEQNERAYMRDVMLVQRLETAIQRINPWISEENLRKVMRELTHPNFAGLMEFNHALYQQLTQYVSVEQDLGKGRKGQTVKIIDFDNFNYKENKYE